MRRSAEGPGGCGRKIFSKLLPSGPLGVTSFSFNHKSSAFPCLALSTGSENFFVVQVHNNVSTAMITIGGRGNTDQYRGPGRRHESGMGPITTAVFGEDDTLAIASGVSGYCATWKLTLPKDPLRDDFAFQIGDTLGNQVQFSRIATFTRATRTTEELGELELTPAKTFGHGWRKESASKTNPIRVSSSSFASIPCSLSWLSSSVLHVTYADGSVRVWKTKAGSGSNTEQRHLLQVC